MKRSYQVFLWLTLCGLIFVSSVAVTWAQTSDYALRWYAFGSGHYANASASNDSQRLHSQIAPPSASQGQDDQYILRSGVAIPAVVAATPTPTLTPTSTATNTPTSTATHAVLPATATATDSPPPTAAPPTHTPLVTNSPTSTDTVVPPVATATDIATDTPIATSVPPTQTPTKIHTAIPLTAIPTTTPEPSDKTWTLFVYAMGDNNLYPYMGNSGMLGRLKTLRNQVEPGVQIVVMLDGPDIGDSNYYTLNEMGLWGPVPLDPPEKQMDKSETLKEFLEWGYELYGESDYYALSILGHATGVLGMGPDDSSSSIGAEGYLEPAEIRDALRDVADLGLRMDVIHFDGCSFGLFESASIVAGLGQHLADYVIASPNTGWGIFAYEVYRELAGTAATSKEYAEQVAQYYATDIDRQGYPYTISVLDMAHYNAVKERMRALGEALVHYIEEQNSDARQQAIRERRSLVQIYDSGNYALDEKSDIYVDLGGFVNEMIGFMADGTEMIRDAARQVKQPLDDFITFTSFKSGSFVENGQTHEHNLDNSTGLGIVYPYSINDGGGHLNRYLNNDIYPNLTRDWGWTKFLKAGLPPLSLGETVVLDIALIAPLAVYEVPPTNTNTPTPTVTLTPTSTPAYTPISTRTVTPTATSTPTPTATQTVMPTATNTTISTPIATPTEVEGVSGEPSKTYLPVIRAE